MAATYLPAFQPRIAAIAPPHYDVAMSFSDTIFLFFLVLILFGPKKLPEMARQAGKLLAELRRASNEFKSQIETEIIRLEVQKVLPPNPPPGSLPSLSSNPPPRETTGHGSLETLTPPAVEVAPLDANSPTVNSVDSTPASATSTSSDPVIEPTVPASQEPHV
jgi:sec-independent protein translocase protein TatB